MRSGTESRPLEGKRILVTGSSQGIGRAVAERIANEGGRVLVNGSGTGPGGRAATQRTLTALIEGIESSGGEAYAFVGSVADDAIAGEMVETAVRALGGLDGVVNCAGIPEPSGSTVETITRQDWERVRQVHLDGTFAVCRHAIPHLIESGDGRIVNTSSHAFLGIYGGSAYAAAKGGINSLTRALAADLAQKNVRCNAICPGARTRLSSGPEYEAQIADLEARGVLSPAMARASRVVAPPAGCAALYAFLLSPGAGFLSGEILSATGGYVGVLPKPEESFIAMSDDANSWELGALETRLRAHFESDARS